MSKNLSQNCCNRKADYNSSRLESKNYGEKYNAKDREVARTKISICPLLPLRIDTHTITIKRDSIHPSSQNIESIRRQK